MPPRHKNTGVPNPEVVHEEVIVPSTLEKIDESHMTMADVHLRYKKMIYDIFGYDDETVGLVGCNYNLNLHLDELYGEYVEKGYEGQMIRLDGPYENKRSPKLLKRKEFVDEEYTILGYEEGKGNRAGTIKHFKFKNKDGRDFNSNVKGTFEYMAELLEKADELIGKEATVKYFNLTPDGVPRFPYVIAIRDYE